MNKSGRGIFFIQSKLVLVLLVALAGTVQAEDWIYYAKDGDTLWDLCLKYTNKKGCWIELAKYNDIADDRRIPLETPVRFPLSWLKRAPVVGKVIYVQGEVFYRSHTGEAYEPLSASQLLHLGDKIKTIAGSVTLRLAGRDEVLLRPDSELELESFSVQDGELSESLLRLNKGTTETRVEKTPSTRFVIETPAATAAVRGTVFRVASEGQGGQKTRAEVLRGAIAVSADNQSSGVPSGFGVAVKKGHGVSAPKQLPAAPQFEHDEYLTSHLPLVLRWQQVPEATAYQLDLDAGSDSSKLLFSRRLTETEYSVDGLEYGCYTLIVSAVDSDSFRGMESEVPLCIVEKLPEPQFLGEPRHLREKGVILFDWADVPDATHYKVEVAVNATFDEILSTYDVTHSEINLDAEKNQKLFLRVTAQAKGGRESDPNEPVEYKSENKDFITSLIFNVLIAIVAF